MGQSWPVGFVQWHKNIIHMTNSNEYLQVSINRCQQMFCALHFEGTVLEV